MRYLYITIVALFMSATSHAGLKTYWRGDVNGDGDVSVADLTALIAKLNGLSPEGFIPQTADVDGSGSVNVGDVKALVEIILGLTEKAKVEFYDNVDETGIGSHVHGAP